MGKNPRGFKSCRRVHPGFGPAPASTPSWAGWSTILPVLPQLLSEFNTCRRPVIAYAITQLCDMAFQIKLVLFKPGHIQFLTGGTAFELSSDVLLIVSNNSGGFLSASTYLISLREITYLVMIPVVLTPSVLCVTRNLPAFLIGA